MNLIKIWYGRWLARCIDRALNNPAYCGQRHQYLCVVLTQVIGGIGPMLAKLYIDRCLRQHRTLHMFLESLTSMKFPHRWSEREVYHRRFYTYLIQHLREGDLQWGRNVTGHDLQLEQYMDIKINEHA